MNYDCIGMDGRAGWTKVKMLHFFYMNKFDSIFVPIDVIQINW